MLRILAFMHGHKHPELAKKLNDKIPKTVDEMFERVRAFIRGEVTAGLVEVARASQRETFTPFTKTPKEILAMESVSFPPSPSLIGTIEKQNLNKFCDYHRDRGHNTNDCYHLKKQIEEAVTLGKLAHLVNDIRQGNQRNKGQGRGNVKNNLTDALIILEVKAEEIECSPCWVFGGNLPLSRVDRPRGNHGRTEKKQNHHAGVRHSQMSLPYNVILGRTRMRSLSAVGSTIHSMVKFPMVNGVATLKTYKEALRECRQIEEMQNSWKETQWRQQMEQMSRIREQAISRNQNIPRRRLGKET
ncbi:hypothetical protein Tco_0002219 [Tanacetum coccineum]